MKNLFAILVLIIVSIALSSTVSAQYSIPAYDVEIIIEPTTFEEGSDGSIIRNINATNTNFIQAPGTDGERKMNVRVNATPPSESATARVLIYSLDGEDSFGPFTVSDESVLEQSIDERDWGVKIVTASTGCEVSVWIE